MKLYPEYKGPVWWGQGPAYGNIYGDGDANGYWHGYAIGNGYGYGYKAGYTYGDGLNDYPKNQISFKSLINDKT
jgi:hypothetical protein